MGDIFEKLKLNLANKSERVGIGEGDCVLWKGGASSRGYGVMRVTWPEEGRKVELVHRVALMAEMRRTPSQFPGRRLEVSHLCHKKLCINPMHLTLEQHAINQERIHCAGQGFCTEAHYPKCIF